MRFLIATALIASGAIAAPAFAQDTNAPDKEFQGFKVLAVGGIDRVNSGGDGETGVGYGGTVGYDYQSGKGVFGVEGEVDGSTAKRCADNALTVGDRLCAKTGRDFYAGARAGYAVSPNVLVYVKGGYTNARATADYTLAGTTTKTSDNLGGWRAGTGVEVNAGKHLVARVEYRYSNYEGDTSRHQGVVGLGFKF
ncbi:MAG: outer membrane beta-barrel protein [Sphingomonas sp.]